MKSGLRLLQFVLVLSTNLDKIANFVKYFVDWPFRRLRFARLKPLACSSFLMAPIFKTLALTSDTRDHHDKSRCRVQWFGLQGLLVDVHAGHLQCVFHLAISLGLRETPSWDVSSSQYLNNVGNYGNWYNKFIILFCGTAQLQSIAALEGGSRQSRTLLLLLAAPQTTHTQNDGHSVIRTGGYNQLTK